VPAAIDAVGGMVPGGWPEVRTRNRSLALEARRILCEALDVAPPAPDSMIGSLVAVPLPPGESRSDPPSRSDVISAWTDPLQQPLVERYGIEVPVFSWPSHPARLVRVSAQLYNEPAQYERLARALVELLGR
jgi:isopenicillin-N epimerase